jgi:hypothetical protein
MFASWMEAKACKLVEKCITCVSYPASCTYTNQLPWLKMCKFTAARAERLKSHRNKCKDIRELTISHASIARRNKWHVDTLANVEAACIRDWRRRGGRSQGTVSVFCDALSLFVFAREAQFYHHNGGALRLTVHTPMRGMEKPMPSPQSTSGHHPPTWASSALSSPFRPISTSFSSLVIATCVNHLTFPKLNYPVLSQPLEFVN